MLKARSRMGKLSFREFVREFANRKVLKKKVGLKFCEKFGRPCLICGEPAIVARFASELRQEVIKRLGHKTKMFMRGQTDDYPKMAPGLFRPPSESLKTQSLLDAEARFENAVSKIGAPKGLGRFKREHLAALLQHYGYRTSWLDVVDNLWTAVWFATHSMDECEGTASRRKNGSGWIYFIISSRAVGCSAIDLRAKHHGLSLRPHTQHGWSVRAMDKEIKDFNQWVVACVKFPIDERWMVAGHLGSAAFVFPPIKLDDTLKRLVRLKTDAIAAKIERGMHLPKKSLGRVTEFM